MLGLFKGIFTHKSAMVDDPDHQAKAVEETVGRLEVEATRLAAERGQVDENYRAGRELLLAESGRAEIDVGQAEAELNAARRFAAELDGRSPAAALRVLGRVRVVVSTFDAVGADPLTLPPEGHGPAFDRLVLTDADRINEPEFAHAARSAARWVMVGDAVGPRGRHGRNGRPARPSLFRRLWGHLHREAWATEAGRLVARLIDADPDRLTCEPLADRPDVDLRSPAAPTANRCWPRSRSRRRPLPPKPRRSWPGNSARSAYRRAARSTGTRRTTG